jgi:outer membrane protease
MSEICRPKFIVRHSTMAEHYEKEFAEFNKRREQRQVINEEVMLSYFLNINVEQVFYAKDYNKISQKKSNYSINFINFKRFVLIINLPFSLI